LKSLRFGGTRTWYSLAFIKCWFSGENREWFVEVSLDWLIGCLRPKYC
jgi:hypothetical protein